MASEIDTSIAALDTTLEWCIPRASHIGRHKCRRRRVGPTTEPSTSAMMPLLYKKGMVNVTRKTGTKGTGLQRPITTARVSKSVIRYCAADRRRWSRTENQTQVEINEPAFSCRRSGCGAASAPRHSRPSTTPLSNGGRKSPSLTLTLTLTRILTLTLTLFLTLPRPC